MANKNIIFKGTLIKANRTAKEFKGHKGKEKLYISLADVTLTDEQFADLNEAFKDSGKKFTPNWLTAFEGYVNVSTVYDLPVRVDGEEYDSLEDFIADNDFGWLRAKVSLKCTIKTGAVYPKAMVIHEEGEIPNAFEGMEE